MDPARDEAYFRSLIDSVVDAIFVISLADGQIVDCNRWACEAYGYSREEFLSLTAYDIEALSARDTIENAHRDIQDGAHYRVEGLHRRRDGSLFPVEIQISRIDAATPGHAVAIVRDISGRKQAGEELRKSEEALRLHSVALEEANTTMKVLLNHREDERRQLEKTVLANIRQLVLPYVEQLIRKRIPATDALLAIIKTNLEMVTAPFADAADVKLGRLSPQEIRVADLVRQGLQDKEIAGLLSASIHTIKAHRRNIRKKLGLLGKKQNLRSYLEMLHKS